MSSPETEKCCSPKPSGSSREKPQPERSGREFSERHFLSQAAAFHTPMSSLRESTSCLERLKKLPLKKHHETQATLWEPQPSLAASKSSGDSTWVSCVTACACVEGRGTGYACLHQETWKTQKKIKKDS